MCSSDLEAVQAHGIPYVIRKNVADEVMALALYNGRIYASDSLGVIASEDSEAYSGRGLSEDELLKIQMLDSANRLIIEIPIND